VESGQRHAPTALRPVKRSGTRCIGGCVGLRAGLDRVFRPNRDSIPAPPSPYRVAMPTALSRPAPEYVYRYVHIAWIIYFFLKDLNRKIKTTKQRTDDGKYSFVNTCRTIKSWTLVDITSNTFYMCTATFRTQI
jgi:hypothetical protein